ncbi:MULTISPECIES: hypothetical protein [Pseudomonas]|jgi:hypothetical protein|uniref:Uncharacterized protein n=1 Tax=Pseudomonas juntendi TaxID=2666183 RepID=A0A7W2LKE8_9PSED|nr:MULTISPECIES: hypothetical protein [Pseudomonas]NOY02647.1 hypothetical protein [Gammaproteobacteria bacterium]PPB13892.1 hypothetical protein HV87_03785 [Pseudomonas aeruginosa]EGC00930.1 hypothetical protein G1E_00481 [Pseudomonas sp. TJI-51]MBA6098231.1 hypothetical protein [Pseudomonas juntendi]MBA6121765.1 hypothetical protein [Pseudomonas juntendi]
MNSQQVAVLGVFLIISPFLMFAVLAFVAHRCLGRIESYLSNSRMVVVNREMYGSSGLFGRVMRLGSISAMLTMRSFSVRKGMLDGEDVRKTPVDLKKLLVRLWVAQILLITLIVLFFTWLLYWQ